MKTKRVSGIDQKILGNEPVDNTYFETSADFTKAYNYYNYHYTRKILSDEFRKIQIEKNQTDLVAVLKVVPFWHVPNIVSVYAILENKNCTFFDDITETYNRAIEKLKNSDLDQFKSEEPTEKAPITRERKQHYVLFGLLDDVIDEFYNNNYELDFNAKLFYEKLDVPNYALEKVAAYYKENIDELKDIPNCADLKEAYLENDGRSKKSIKAEIEFLENIISAANNIINNRKRVRKPRKKKEISANQIVAEVNYCKYSKDLDITSLDPAKIINKNMIYLYNEKYKRMTVLSSKDGFTIRGTTIYDWDKEKSYAQTIRKPKVIISQIVEKTKRDCKKVMDSLTTKRDETSLSGRLSEQVLILRIF